MRWWTTMTIMTWSEFLQICRRINSLNRLARKIEQAREVKTIETTTELAEIIKSAKPAKEAQEEGPSHKQIFQAIRIEVTMNGGATDESIQQAMEMLALDGRISVITFHSLEDRLTKQLFRKLQRLKFQKACLSSQMISSPRWNWYPVSPSCQVQKN